MTLTRRRVLAARAVAVAADAVQLGLLPIFVQGALSPVNDALDVAVAVAMIALVGWHWAFLPAFVSELIPFFGLVPTWTAAALIATREGAPPEPPAPPGATGPPSPSPGPGTSSATRSSGG